LGVVAQVVAKVANFLADMIAQAVKAIDTIGRFVDSLPDLPSITLPFTATVPTGVGVGARAGGPGRVAALGGGVQVNIYGGDPTRVEAAVARALQGYTRRNGVLGLAGMAGR
jgi:hypothetical protein